jgi:hypothetical protein
LEERGLLAQKEEIDEEELYSSVISMIIPFS